MENNTKFRDELTRYIEKKRAEIAKQEVDSNKAMEKIRLVNQSYLECALSNYTLMKTAKSSKPANK